MRKIPAIVAAMVLVAYGYLFATVKPAPIWEPSKFVWCVEIGGSVYCWEFPDDWPEDEEG